MLLQIATTLILVIAALASIAQPARADECISMCERCQKDADCCQNTPDGPRTNCICRLLPQPLLQQEREVRGNNSARCQCFGVADLFKACTAINYAKMMKAEAARVKALAAVSTERSNSTQQASGN